MIEVWKMKYAGCCNECLSVLGEKDIYRIEGKRVKIELCKECFSEFIEDINKKYSELFDEKE